LAAWQNGERYGGEMRFDLVFSVTTAAVLVVWPLAGSRKDLPPLRADKILIDLML